MVTIDTRELVLDVAQEFLQTRGYNGFSFRDIAGRVGIKSASIHYYFPTKAELCLALIRRHRNQIQAAFSTIDLEETDPERKLFRYASVFKSTLEVGNRMCMCGMLASDLTNLDPSVVEELRESINDHERWLIKVLNEGTSSGRLKIQGSARDEARLFFSTLEGVMLIARAFEDLARFEQSVRSLLTRWIPDKPG